MKCFECDTTEHIQQHHVVPRSRGGTRTIPLCTECHGKVHGKKMAHNEVTRDALASIRASGRKTGGDVPYGYTVGADGRTLVACERECRVITTVRELRLRGLSLRKVSEALAERGMLNRTGRPFHAKSIANLERLTA